MLGCEISRASKCSGVAGLEKKSNHETSHKLYAHMICGRVDFGRSLCNVVDPFPNLWARRNAAEYS